MDPEQTAEWMLEQLKRDSRLTEHALVLSAVNAMRVQLERIELQNAEVLAFRDLILETAGPFLTGGKSKVWLALLAKSKGAPKT